MGMMIKYWRFRRDFGWVSFFMDFGIGNAKTKLHAVAVGN
jgi:hypothetical protein